MSFDKLEKLEDRVIGLLARSIRQLEDVDPNCLYTRQQIQSIESIEKTILIIDNRLKNRKIEGEMDNKSEDELKSILAYSEED